VGTSEEMFREACRYIPGGVNSPVRACGSVGGRPVYIDRGSGSKLYDVEGREYVDYVCSWGPLILGHAHEGVLRRIGEAMAKGTSFGANTGAEIALARRITELYPSVERVRMVNSGTEAAMSAVRLARGYTGRDKIIKCEGCYHGHGDGFLIKAGSGVLTLGIPGSPGVTENAARDTLIGRFNDIGSAEELFRENRGNVAALIVEPIMGNAGVVPPVKGFLEALRDLTASEGALLIFDEVITGFRVAPGGAQQLYGVRPDLTCLGKIIGGGLPVGAFGGRGDIMAELAPLGPVYQAGTLSGNPLAMAAGLETLRVIDETPGFYERLETLSGMLEEGTRANMKGIGNPFAVNRVGSMMSLFFTGSAVTDFETALQADTDLFARYHAGMLRRGVYLAPSQFEASFVSIAHDEGDIALTLEAQRDTLEEVLSA
jgi:glutamate-1-semialdehyde 2,1-aminomutase